MEKTTQVHHMHLVLHADEFKKLLTNAKRCGLSRSAYLRRLIMKTPIRESQSKEIRDLYVEINRIGSNINQIARSVNAGVATPETARQSLFLLEKVHDLMYRIACK